MQIIKSKVWFLFLGGIITFSSIGALIFLGILIWGIPQMNPYPSNPFFLFTMFAFTTYLAIAKAYRFKNVIRITCLDIVWIVVACLSTMIWYSYTQLEPGTIFGWVYIFLTFLSGVCWLGYLFVGQSVRSWFKTLSIYLFITAILYYIFFPFWLPFK